MSKYKICQRCKTRAREGTICLTCNKFFCYNCDSIHLHNCNSRYWEADEQ